MLDADRILNSGKYGSVFDAMYCDSNNQIIAPLKGGILRSYKSQYGLQGIIFSNLSGLMNVDNAMTNIRLLCCILSAFVFAVIVLMLYFKYNKLLAGVFLYTFWLSPWVTTFAHYTYWVEFTWFVPMAIGLLCSLKIEQKKYRIACYIFAFVSIMVKSLCGYEYISVVMMGLIAILLIDFANAVFVKDKDRSILIFRTIFALGICALLGFFVAILIHAPLRGDGNILAGIKDIWNKDVLRRTVGGNLNEFETDLRESFNASVWETLCKYFKFSTDVVTGISGNLFPVLCVAPLLIFINDIQKKKVNVTQMAMYLVFFITSISWFCLAKGHSAIHVHLNYVLWYFGFVQTCIYILLDRVTGLCRRD